MNNAGARGAAILVALLAAVAWFPSAAQAHARSESYSNWNVADAATTVTVTGTVTVSAAEVMNLVALDNTTPLDQLFATHVAETVAVRTASGDCQAAAPTALSAARGFVRTEISFDCGGEQPTEITYRALMDAVPVHVHYARVFSGDALLGETVLTSHSSTWLRVDGDGTRHSFGAFLDLGVRHILGGIDHIAFLIGMLLVAGTLGRSVAAVTGFTLGHSVSLGAAVLGYVHADGRLVEAFIGFTVALVALEYFLVSRQRVAGFALLAAAAAWSVGALALSLGVVDARASAAYLGFGAFAFCYLLAATRMPTDGGRSGALLFAATACFGVIHGFGFAGFLMDTGLGGGSLFLPLLGFNLGVEVGQLALLGVAFAAIHLLRTTKASGLAPAAAAGLCGIGLFWFVGRSLAI